MLHHKTSLNKFQSTEIIHNKFSDHNAMKLEINSETVNRKCPCVYKLNKMHF